MALLLLAFAAFTALALFAPRLLTALTARSNRRDDARNRVRRPHTALVLVFRLWFALLAFLTLWLLRHPHSH